MAKKKDISKLIARADSALRRRRQIGSVNLDFVQLKGKVGEKGVQGLRGIQGVQGFQGAQGFQGDKGDKGDVGVQGLTGKEGKPSSLQGKPGKAGLKGTVGKVGVKGLKGEKGIQGKDGSPDNGEEIIVKINKDKSDKLIRKGKVEGLDDIESMARTARANSLRHYGTEKFEQLTDVVTTGKTNDSIVQYNSTTELWTRGVAITVSSTEPSSPNLNDLWVDTT